jgi:hypothetical protein
LANPSALPSQIAIRSIWLSSDQAVWTLILTSGLTTQATAGLGR